MNAFSLIHLQLSLLALFSTTYFLRQIWFDNYLLYIFNHPHVALPYTWYVWVTLLEKSLHFFFFFFFKCTPGFSFHDLLITLICLVTYKIMGPQWGCELYYWQEYSQASRDDLGGFTPGKSLLCAAPFSQDQKWYRARIDSIQEKLVVVTYIDFGNSENVNITDLRKLLPHLREPNLQV